MNSNLIKLLLALCILFFLIFLLELNFSGASEGQLEPVNLNDEQQQNQEVKLPEIKLSKKVKDTYINIVEKPLFIKGRRPVAETVDVIKKTIGGKVDDVILDGIYSVEGRMIALMRENKSAKEYLKKSEGDEIDGWTLKELQTDRVILESAGDEKSIMLRKPRSKPKKKPKKPEKRKPLAPKNMKPKS